MELAIDNNMAAQMEFKIPLSSAPGTIEKAKYKTIPLITNENNPKVKIVIGNEKNCIMGFTIKLRQPKIMVSIIKADKEPIYTLDIKFEIINKDIALITINKDILLMLILLFF